MDAGGSGNPDLASHGIALGARVVARRKVDRVQHERAGARHLAHSCMPTHRCQAGAKWTEAPKVVTRLNFRSDRQGYTDDYYRHIFLIPRRRGGTPRRQITNGDWNSLRTRVLGGQQGIVLFSSLLWRARRRKRKPQVADLRRERFDRRSEATHASQRLQQRSVVFTGRQADRVHVRRFGRPLGVGRIEAMDDERRRIQRALGVWNAGPSDLLGS